MSNHLDSRPLTLTDAENAARVISLAFMDDPLIKFMLPFKRTRFQTLYKYFRPMTAISIGNGKVYGVGEPLQGVAYWKAPEQKSMAVSVKNLIHFLPLLLTLFPIGFLRAKKLVEKTEAMHTRYADEPHYYLENLGVVESARGQGFASRLIHPILARADQQKVIAYTDTVNPANVPLYEHFGFQCVEAAPIREIGITVFALRRSLPG
jgi:ribosomal protein S18 acetylase RimI-like enzyme